MINILKRFSFNRKITSYSKIQRILTPIIRSQKFFINFKKIQTLEYLNVGCSSNIHEGYIHLDYNWHYKLDICWDINKLPYPLKKKSLKGIYSEHCLEHITLNSFKRNIEEFYRLLAPGGTIRIVVPDGEKYVNWYLDIKSGKVRQALYGELEPTPMMNLNDIFRNYGHQYIYDFETIALILNNFGFIDIKKEKFRQGRDKFLLIDLERRADESLYIEAVKPF